MFSINIVFWGTPNSVGDCGKENELILHALFGNTARRYRKKPINLPSRPEAQPLENLLPHPYRKRLNA